MFGCRTAQEPSTIDDKPLDLDENMDNTVKPGNDFFMYANGAWWNKTDMQGGDFRGFMPDVQTVSNQRVANLNYEPITQFRNKIQNIDNDTQAAVELINKHLKLVENINTPEQAQDAIINTIIIGYDNLFNPRPFNKDGNTLFGIAISKTFSLNFEWVQFGMQQLGFEDAYQRNEKAKELYYILAQGTEALDLSLNNKNYPKLVDRMVALNSTKASGSKLLDKILQTLKVDINNVFIDEMMSSFFQLLENAEPEAVKCLLQAYIADQYRFTSRRACDDYLSFNPPGPEANPEDVINDFDGVMKQFQEQKMQYLYSYAYSKQYLSEERKSKMQSYCQEIRTAFGSRIAQIDWMSEPTKQKALEKLNAMKFHVGCPDKWIESALPKTLAGASMLENMFTLSLCQSKIVQELVNIPAQEACFHEAMYQWPIEIVNAFYAVEVNALVIFPVWMLEPLYDEQKSEAYNYAILAVVGHEITHGFDNDGAKYDKIGKLENWWTVADQMEFTARQQKLIECYNLLEIMPKELPGQYANGVKTLSENIADLGGCQVAFNAYNAKLLMQGYTAEELIKQHKKFFQAYANLWRNKYTSAFAMKMWEQDEHALSRERVNGVVMNVDSWYDLYDVKWGDKLYLKPEKRTYIW